MALQKPMMIWVLKSLCASGKAVQAMFSEQLKSVCAEWMKKIDEQ